jgi:hypothetical protein
MKLFLLLTIENEVEKLECENRGLCLWADSFQPSGSVAESKRRKASKTAEALIRTLLLSFFFIEKSQRQHISRFALFWLGIQMHQQALDTGEIGVEVQHAENITSRYIGLPGGTEGHRQINADGAAVRHSVKGSLPQLHGSL